MYPSRGTNAYGQQQSYSSQAAYPQNLVSGHSASSAAVPDGSSQLLAASRHSSMLGGSQEANASGYRTHGHHPSSGPNYGGQYSAVYGSSAQQTGTGSGKASASSTLEGRTGFNSSITDSTKYTLGDYVSSSGHAYGHKAEVFSERVGDYSTLERRQYAERHSTYAGGRDLNIEPTSHYQENISFNKHQAEIYDRMDQASIIRKEQLLKAQGLQSGPLEGVPRQGDYLAARTAAVRHAAQNRLSAQELIAYSTRSDPDPHTLSTLGSSSFDGQHAPSILGAAPQRRLDDLIYSQSSSNPGYGVSLPPGRDYGIAKGLHASSLDSDFPSILARHSRMDDYKDDRIAYARELERVEKERLYLRAHDKDREREKERERERDREREREKERERERQRKRERERERERILERKEKERDNERKRGTEARRERTPPRISREPRGTSLTKDSKSLRRDSPRHEVLHRRHSPVKETRREYVCKVYSSSLLEAERDYLALDKIYPRLFISPECTKVVVHWPKGNLKLSLYTPVSFEHDFVEGEASDEQKLLSPSKPASDLKKSDHGLTIWNAKMILMSGLSKNALDELSSDRNYDDRIPHFCNMLRFAILKKDNSLMAIGGPWDIVDGGDPSVDDSALVKTILRYAKEITNLELKDCQNWNRFLEIHYDRFGKDGMFSHKEVTVYFVPDLSDCKPSMDLWREQWVKYKKAIAERERMEALRREKHEEVKDIKDKDLEKQKDAKRDTKGDKKNENGAKLKQNKADKDGSDKKATPNKADKEGSDKKTTQKKTSKPGSDKKTAQSKAVKDGSEKKTIQSEHGVVETHDESTTDSVAVIKTGEGETDIQPEASVKTGKKKIVRRIVKKAVSKKVDASTSKEDDEVMHGKAEEKAADEDGVSKQDASATPNSVKTFVRKKIIKKVPVVKTANKVNEPTPSEVNKSAPSETVKNGVDNISVVQGASVKRTIKKKIIKRVLKRKVAADSSNGGVNVAEDNKDHMEEQISVKGDIDEVQIASNSQEGLISSEIKVIPKVEQPSPPAVTKEKRVEEVCNTTLSKTESGTNTEKKSSPNNDCVKLEAKEQPDEDKDKKEKKDTSKSKSVKEVKEKRSEDKRDEKDISKSKSIKEVKVKKSDEPPRHPGFILRTQGDKNFKLQSMSLSLDSLLDYTDKDVDDSRFELSLFAESMYELLYYEMGSRLLTFLKELRIKSTIKRNQRKRERDEASKRETEEKSAAKRAKTEESKDDNELPGVDKHNKDAISDGKESPSKEEATTISSAKIEEVKIQDDSSVQNNTDEDEDEDPEEDPDEYEENAEDEEMVDVKSENETDKENVEGKTDGDTNTENVDGDEMDGKQVTCVDASKSSTDADVSSKGDKVTKAEIEAKSAHVEIDKDLLQAFRFFDRNRVGYVRVADLRLIIHNLGKSLSNRDVKDLVLNALVESNTSRDDRIIYNKLVKMSA
ncbi:unnamed protein product [Cuscuta epithymum]|uniref:EF-hand domain-containing protein n=1 Tax=Cuscuta epithymum TaxID=186058 RepID=A0AAV0DIV7_9ASTE|nr:unnamed protein product [Cuscuta epithymum]